MDQGVTFYRNCVEQVYRAARAAILSAKNSVEVSHATTQLVKRLCGICEEIEQSKESLLQQGFSVQGLIKLLNEIDGNLRLIGDATVEKHSGTPGGWERVTVQDAVSKVINLVN